MTKRLAFMLAIALGACAGSGSGRVEYAAAVTVRSPQLMPIQDVEGVYVLADADEPVFYTDDYYWLYREGRWYRSHSYDRDWIYVSTPSPRLRSIRQPTAYVRFSVRQQEARNIPQPSRDDVRDLDRERTDVPGTLPPHQQPPLQPTQPQQPVPPYPRPPQQEPPVDHHIAPPATGDRLDVPTPPPAQVDRTRTDRRPDMPPGQAHRPSTPPGQDRGQDVRTPGETDVERGEADRPAQPPGQAKRDTGRTAPPGQSQKTDETEHDHGGDTKAQKTDKRKQEKANQNKKRDY